MQTYYCVVDWLTGFLNHDHYPTSTLHGRFIVLVSQDRSSRVWCSHIMQRECKWFTTNQMEEKCHKLWVDSFFFPLAYSLFRFKGVKKEISALNILGFKEQKKFPFQYVIKIKQDDTNSCIKVLRWKQNKACKIHIK